METKYITWKSFIDPKNRRPVHIYPREPYDTIEVVHTTIGITIGLGLGDPVVIAKLFPGQSGAFRIDGEYTEIVITPEYHQNLVITNQDETAGFTTIRLSHQNWRQLGFPGPLWKSYRVPQLAVSNSHDAIHGPGTDRLVDAPVLYAITTLRSPDNGFYSPAATTAYEASTYLDDYQGVAIYGLDKVTSPSFPRLRLVNVGQNGEVRTEITGSMTLPVNVVNSMTLPVNIVSPATLPVTFNRSQPNNRATYENVYLYTAIVRSASAGSRGVSLPLAAGGTASLLAVAPGSSGRLGLRRCTCTVYGASATSTLALRWQRYTGSVTGGTVVSTTPLALEGPSPKATVISQPSAIGGLISTPRYEQVIQVSTTSYAVVETLPEPLDIVAPQSYGYALIIEASAAVTVPVHVVLTFEEF